MAQFTTKHPSDPKESIWEENPRERAERPAPQAKASFGGAGPVSPDQATSVYGGMYDAGPTRLPQQTLGVDGDGSRKPAQPLLIGTERHDGDWDGAKKGKTEHDASILPSGHVVRTQKANTERSSSKLGLGGRERERSTTESTKVDYTDTLGMAKQIKGQLEARLGNLAVQRREIEAQMRAREDELLGEGREGPHDRGITRVVLKDDPGYRKLPDQLAAIPKQAADIQMDIQLVAKAGAERNLATLKLMASATSVDVAPAYATAMEKSRSSAHKDKLGLGGKSTTDTETYGEVRPDGTGHSRKDESKSELSWADASMSKEKRSSVTEKLADKRSATVEEGTKKKWSAAHGEIAYTRTRDKGTVTRDADGEVIEEHKKGTSMTGGAIIKKDELGGKVKVGSSKSDEKDGVKTSRDLDAGAQLTTKGLSGDAALKGERDGDHLKVTGKVSADGSFIVDATHEEGSDPPVYRVTCTLTIGGAVGTGLEVHDKERTDKEKKEATDADVKASASVSGGVRGSGELTYSHLMSLDEAKKYFRAADQAETKHPSQDYPEFSHLGRLKLLYEEVKKGGGMGNVLALGDSGQAAKMDRGASIQFVLTAGTDGGAKGNLGGSGGGVGVEGSTSTTHKRLVNVEHLENGHVQVTVSFVDAEEGMLGGSASLGMASAGHKAKSGATHETTSVFELDPTDKNTYDADYNKILAANQPGRLAAVSAELSKKIKKRVRDDGASEGSTNTFGVGKASIAFGEDRQRGHKVTQDEKGRTDVIMGGSSTGATASVSGTTIAKSSTADSATGTVDPKGELSVKLERKQTGTSFFDSVKETASGLAKDAQRWFGQDEKDADDYIDAGAGLLKSPKARLDAMLSKTYTRLSGYRLGAGDVVELTARAGDCDKWMRCASSPRIREPWAGLGVGLLDPHPDPELTQADPVRAESLARAQAVADYMESVPGFVWEPLQHALRRYGETARGSEANLGERFEWPPGLGKTKEQLERIEKMVAGLGAKMADFAAHGGGTGVKYCEDLEAQLRTIAAAVSSSTDFASAVAQGETLRSIHLLDEKVAATRIDLRHQPSHEDPSHAAGPGAPPDVAGELAHGAGEHERAPRTPEQEKAALRVQHRAAELRLLKQRETSLYNQAFALLGDEQASKDALLQVLKAPELHKLQIEEVKELREAYRDAGITDGWLVSAGPGKERLSLDPNVPMFVNVYLEVNPDKSPGRRDIADAWRAEWRAY